MNKQLRYRYSFIHRGEKHWRTSPPTLATVETFLTVNDLDMEPARVIRALDLGGTFVATVDQTAETMEAGTNIVEIDEFYV